MHHPQCSMLLEPTRGVNWAVQMPFLGRIMLGGFPWRPDWLSKVLKRAQCVNCVFLVIARFCPNCELKLNDLFFSFPTGLLCMLGKCFPDCGLGYETKGGGCVGNNLPWPLILTIPLHCLASVHQCVYSGFYSRQELTEISGVLIMQYLLLELTKKSSLFFWWLST